jgi:hypothetical protein
MYDNANSKLQARVDCEAMVGSILMLFSQYNKNTTLMNISAGMWVFYMLSSSSFRWNFFTVVNLVVFLVTTAAVRKIKNERLNLLGATSSILLYSIFVDVICYHLYPHFVFNKNLLFYICDGLLFNSKYVFLNGLVVAFIAALKKLAPKETIA